MTSLSNEKAFEPLTNLYYELILRGAFNQECESIHKIRMNKGTEVVNSL